MTSAKPSKSSRRSGPDGRQERPGSPLRVAVTGFRGIPATWGGVEHQCEELYTRLASMGHDITVYARSGYVPVGIRTHRGVRIQRIGTIPGKYTEAIVHTLLSVLHLVLTNPQIVHIYSQGPCVLIPLLKLLRPRIHVVFTCVGLDWRRKKWPGWASRIIKLGEICSARFPDRHVVVSRELQDYYRAEYGVEAITIPNGVNPADPGTLGGVQTFGFEPRGYFLFVGRLVPEKRVEDLLSAYLARPRRSRLVIAGDAAGTESYARRLREMGAASGSVSFVGYQYGRTLGALYANARGFLTASELEGMPLTLLEALAHGLFCIASDIAPHREVLDGAPHALFPVGGLEPLSDGLERLDRMGPAELDALGWEARRHVADCFSWDRAADRLEALYAECAASRFHERG